MSGAAAYGLIGGLVFPVVLFFAPRIGTALVWSLITIQLGWYTQRVWRLTRLPFMTLGGALGVLAGVIAVFALAVGYQFPMLPIPLAIPFYSLLAMIPACLVVEQRIHPEEYERWRQFMKDKSAWAIFRGRHIPDLRR